MSLMLGKRVLELPLIQGGMGIGVSFGRLAGTVASCGAMGTVSTAVCGFAEPDFLNRSEEANARVLMREVEKARRLAGGKGLVAVNAMVATREYAQSIAAAIRAGVDAIVSGAGLPSELPALAKGADVLLAPIVSGARAARTICKMWEKRHSRYPDFIVVEGAAAGGHLGFSPDELFNQTAKPLETLVQETATAIKPFEAAAQRRIPIFAAGGIWDGKDAARMQQHGAAGVQLATRFIATYECDASQSYKNILLSARQEDIEIIKSPVGMPGRALRTPLIDALMKGLQIPHEFCVGCLTPCPKAATPYCIADALIEAWKGNRDKGLFFCGANAWRLDKMRHVHELIDEIMTDWRAYA